VWIALGDSYLQLSRYLGYLRHIHLYALRELKSSIRISLYGCVESLRFQLPIIPVSSILSTLRSKGTAESWNCGIVKVGCLADT